MISGPEIKKIFQENADRIFFVDVKGGLSWTYKDFHRLVLKMVQGIQAEGLARGDRFAVLLQNSVELAALYFAAILSGTVIMPLNPKLHPREIETILVLSKPKVLICSSATRDLSGSLPKQLQLVLIDAWGSSGEFDGWEQAYEITDPSRVFLVTFTSGTTGLPKGVAHTISSLFENARVFNQVMHFEASDVFLHAMPMAYMAGILNTLIAPFLSQGVVVSIPPFDAQTALSFWNPVIQYRVNAMWLAPTMLAALLKVDRDPRAPQYCRYHLKAISVGTAPLPVRTKMDFESKYGTTLYESYGLTELLFVSTNAPGHRSEAGSVGRLLSGVDIRMTDEYGKTIDFATDGEIWIKTPFFMAGYLDSESSALRTVSRDEWFQTGDIGHLDAEGNLRITGRKKDLIIKGGMNISPRAIEEILLRHPAVAEAAVVGIPHEFFGEEVVAAVVLKTRDPIEQYREPLLNLCKQNLNAASIPSRFLGMPEFPVNASGKIQKRELVERISRMGLFS